MREFFKDISKGFVVMVQSDYEILLMENKEIKQGERLFGLINRNASNAKDINIRYAKENGKYAIATMEYNGIHMSATEIINFCKAKDFHGNVVFAKHKKFNTIEEVDEYIKLVKM